MERNELSELRDQVQTAERFRAVLDSEPWQFVLDRAQRQTDEAMADLKRVDPENTAEIRRLQGIVARNDGIGLWLREILDDGALAREALLSAEIIENGQ